MKHFDQTKNTSIQGNTYEALGYIGTHRYDPIFKDTLRSVGFFGTEFKIKKDLFDLIKSIWDEFKGRLAANPSGSLKWKKRIGRRLVGPLFDQTDSILNSLGIAIPYLDIILEIKEPLQNWHYGSVSYLSVLIVVVMSL